jgi:hypothetical protein
MFKSFAKRIEKIALGMMYPANPYATSIIGLFTLLWGLWIVNPFWHVFTSAALYEKAAGFAPEWAWGSWSTLCGLVILIALYKGSFKRLIDALAFCVWHWFTIAVFYFWGDWQNTGGLTYLFVGVLSLYMYLNIKFNHGQKRQKHRF